MPMVYSYEVCNMWNLCYKLMSVKFDSDHIISSFPLFHGLCLSHSIYFLCDTYWLLTIAISFGWFCCWWCPTIEFFRSPCSAVLCREIVQQGWLRVFLQGQRHHHRRRDHGSVGSHYLSACTVCLLIFSIPMHVWFKCFDGLCMNEDCVASNRVLVIINNG